MGQMKKFYLYMLGIVICGMICTACGRQEIGTDNLAEQAEQTQTNLFQSESSNVADKDITEDVDSVELSEEQLYWIDHEERVTVLEYPTRRFVEIRAIDTERVGDGSGVMPYFGMLKEADYEVKVSDDGPMLDIHFSFAKEPLEAGYETPLYDNKCMEMNYIMTVTDQESGRVLQEDTVELCIDAPDMITFGDLNKDRYIDMLILLPAHYKEGYQREGFGSRWWKDAEKFWNPEQGIFTDIPISSLYSNIKKLTEEGSREYVVQPGDSLWSISERFYGSGYYWTELNREENVSEDPSYLLPGEIIDIPNGINFP